MTGCRTFDLGAFAAGFMYLVRVRHECNQFEYRERALQVNCQPYTVGAH